MIRDVLEQLAALAALALFTGSILIWAEYLCEVLP